MWLSMGNSAWIETLRNAANDTEGTQAKPTGLFAKRRPPFGRKAPLAAYLGNPVEQAHFESIAARELLGDRDE